MFKKNHTLLAIIEQENPQIKNLINVHCTYKTYHKFNIYAIYIPTTYTYLNVYNCCVISQQNKYIYVSI